MASRLDADAVAAVDSTGQAAEIVDLPTHLRDALWRVDSANVPPFDAPGGLIVAGMGGSAVLAELGQSWTDLWSVSSSSTSAWVRWR